MAGNLDFFFFYGSVHPYLSVMRIGALAAAARVEVRWRLFNLREILIGQNEFCHSTATRVVVYRIQAHLP